MGDEARFANQKIDKVVLWIYVDNQAVIALVRASWVKTPMVETIIYRDAKHLKMVIVTKEEIVARKIGGREKRNLIL